MIAGLSSFLLRCRPTTLRAACVALALASLRCDRPPAADSLPEWTQSDHHSNDDNRAATGAQASPPPSKPSNGGSRPSNGQAQATEIDQLVDLTWRQQCTTCHGPTGHGDGQMGPMVQAPDLTLADWQEKVMDAEMGAIIKMGRNRMPAFNLPDPVVMGLIARVRALKSGGR